MTGPERIAADAAWHKDAYERWDRAYRRSRRTSWPAVAVMWLALIGHALDLTPYWLWVASVVILVALLVASGAFMLAEHGRERRHLRSGEHVESAEIRVWLRGDL